MVHVHGGDRYLPSNGELAVHRLLRLFFVAWWHILRTDRNFLVPEDSPHVTFGGNPCSRVVLLGDGQVAGVGVLTHQLGLVGALARSVATLTGEGCAVTGIGDAETTLHDLVELDTTDLPLSADVLVIAIGVNDALRCIPLSDWERDLKVLHDRLVMRGKGNLRFLVIEIPVEDMIEKIGGIRGLVASRHAIAMNNIMRNLDYVDLTTIALPSSQGVGRKEWPLSRDWTAPSYSSLGCLLAPCVAGLLKRTAAA